MSFHSLICELKVLQTLKFSDYLSGISCRQAVKEGGM